MGTKNSDFYTGIIAMCDTCGVKLTSTECRVLELRVRYKKTNLEIANTLHVLEGKRSEIMVRNHFNKIYHKLGVGGPITDGMKQRFCLKNDGESKQQIDQKDGNEVKQRAAETYYWWHEYREFGMLGSTSVENPKAKRFHGAGLRIPIPAVFLVAILTVAAVLIAAWIIPQFHPRAPASIPLPLDYFEVQSSDDTHEDDEYIFDFRFNPISLPFQPEKGVDLRQYRLQVSFEGGEGKKVQLWYKDKDWNSVYSRQYFLSEGPICYNPFQDGRDVDEFTDFSSIYAVGVRIIPDAEGVRIVSAKLVPSCE